MGPQICKPKCFESGVHIVTRKEEGVRTGAPALRLMTGAPPLCCHATAAPRLILLQPAGKLDAAKAPGPHQFHEQLVGNKSFLGFMKQEKADCTSV